MDRLKLALIVTLLASPAAAQQCGTLTTCPPVSTPLGGTELLYTVQGGVSKKMTVTQLGAAIGPEVSLAPGQSKINPSTPGGVLFDNNGVLGDSTTLPSGLTAPNFTVTGSFTATGLVTNSDLANSTISGVALGSNLNALTFGAHLATGGSSYNGSAGVTVTSDATSAGTPSTIVARDASGNFAAGKPSTIDLGNATDLPASAINGGAFYTGTSSINADITAVGSAKTVILYNLATTLSASLTVPSNVTLQFQQGGSITQGAAYTLAINGHISSPLTQIFSGFSPGQITFGADSVDAMWAEWWGASPSASGSVNGSAIRSEIQACFGGPPAWIGYGAFTIAGSGTPSGTNLGDINDNSTTNPSLLPCHFHGMGAWGVTTLKNDASSPFSVIAVSAGTGGTAIPFEWDGMTIDGNGANNPQQSVTVAATASFTTSSPNITMTTNPGTVFAGMNVYDLTNSQQIGTVSTYVGAALVLTANAAHASSGSTDSLSFSNGDGFQNCFYGQNVNDLNIYNIECKNAAYHGMHFNAVGNSKAQFWSHNNYSSGFLLTGNVTSGYYGNASKYYATVYSNGVGGSDGNHQLDCADLGAYLAIGYDEYVEITSYNNIQAVSSTCQAGTTSPGGVEISRLYGSEIHVISQGDRESIEFDQSTNGNHIFVTSSNAADQCMLDVNATSNAISDNVIHANCYNSQNHFATLGTGSSVFKNNSFPGMSLVNLNAGSPSAALVVGAGFGNNNFDGGTVGDEHGSNNISYFVSASSDAGNNQFRNINGIGNAFTSGVSTGLAASDIAIGNTGTLAALTQSSVPLGATGSAKGALSVVSCVIPDTAGTGVNFCAWQAAFSGNVATYFDSLGVTYLSTCSTTYPIVEIYDVTKSTAVGATTVPNTGSTITGINATAASAASTDEYAFRVTTAGSGCSSTLGTEFIYLAATVRQ